jgi:hypothetical protein
MSDKDEIVRHLQQQVDQERAQPIEIQLADLGPYKFPRCTDEQGAEILDTQTLGIWLVTERGQRVLIPLSGPLPDDLSHLLRETLMVARMTK